MLWKRTRKYVSSSLSLTTKGVLCIEHACPALKKHAVLLIAGVVFAHCSLNSTSRPLGEKTTTLQDNSDHKWVTIIFKCNQS